jgi:hypothetical protein
MKVKGIFRKKSEKMGLFCTGHSLVYCDTESIAVLTAEKNTQ